MAEVDDSLFNRAEIAAQRDKDDLLDRLDVLLERYLHTLHEYQKVMQELTKQMSSGYLSLAQANFHNSSAIRYGQDCYDERMQAIRKVRVSEQGCLKYNRPHFSIQSEETASQGVHVSEADKKAYRKDVEGQGSMFKHTELGVNASEFRDPPKMPRIVTEEASSDPEQEPTTDQDENKDEEEKKGEKSIDPLRWFGILVPPALRTAQTTFVGAVEGPIPQLATIARDMKTQEIEIGRVKKQIKKLL